MGQPDVDLRKRKDGLWEVQVNGFDYFDPKAGDLVSGGNPVLLAARAHYSEHGTTIRSFHQTARRFGHGLVPAPGAVDACARWICG